MIGTSRIRTSDRTLGRLSIALAVGAGDVGAARMVFTIRSPGYAWRRF